MSANKPAWTTPGPIDQAAYEEAEARKGTAAANPVLSLAPGGHAGGHRAALATADGAVEHAPDTRSPAEIEADIEQTRFRLAGTLDELTERLSPRAAMRRGNASVRSAFRGPDGSVRKDRAAMAAGALAAVAGAAVALRKLRHLGRPHTN
jgi:hypothetical protein